ncbi:iron ABC transporter ATP-binding protein [Cryobacterium fucosi]|uniref:Iron ABC transporter ATP-binding protein n=1 Tax=Cryobacterium fucosi TaxID=1259157 RepID=A0A4R9BF72_9MICO|nr:iron ABC transporter ATP-binding protein [Cryobacterium fucosi]TFD81156.1 iron ABC transporter ATP-binding protein [Cryobacterium fucosi]
MTDSFSRSLLRSRRLRAGLVLATASLALAALTGCSPAATPSASGSSTPSASASASPTATPTPTPTPAGAAVTLTCDQLLTPDDVYAFNPNYGTAPGFTATSATAKTALSYQGLACGLLNQTSGEIIEISVALPNPVLMTTLTDKAIASSNPVPTYGATPVSGFFTTKGGNGEAQVFTEKYWVTFSSPVFGEPGDAEQLMSAALSHLQ